MRFLSVMLIKRHVRFSILAPFGIVFFALWNMRHTCAAIGSLRESASAVSSSKMVEPAGEEESAAGEAAYPVAFAAAEELPTLPPPAAGLCPTLPVPALPLAAGLDPLALPGGGK